jgi:serine/threonine protein kinase
MAEMIYAGEFATESEKRAAAILAKLPNDWTVICNKMLPAHGRTSEIDFIIIGQRLVFLLDEKSWSDPMTGGDQFWFFANGTSVTNPVNKVDYVARPLAGHLRAKVPSLSDGYLVHAGILLTNAKQPPKINDPRVSNQVFIGSTVIAKLPALDRQQRYPLDAAQRVAIRTSLFDLSQRPKTPTQIGDFQISEVSDGPAGIQVFQATLNGAARTLLVYDLTKSRNRAETQAFYDREFKALDDLQATQVVAAIKDPFIWSEDFRVLPIVPPQGSVLATIPPAESSAELADELRRASSCFETLHIIHSKQVIHRALTPAAIVMQGTGAQQKAIFTNFFAARIEEQSIALQLDLLELTDPYAHPALAASYGQANRATDQYSLALIFLERVSRQAVADLRRDTRALPNLYTRWSNAPQQVIQELTELFDSLLNGDFAQPRDARAVGTIFGDLATRLNPKNMSQPTEQLLDKRYKVLRLLGKGAAAQTYLVSDIRFPELGFSAIKHFDNAADVLPQAQAEFNALKSVNTKHLPRIFDIFPAEQDAHVKMEYIPGQTLEELQSEFPWQLDQWWKLADHLLNALHELEEQRLFHRDIKPANIIYDTEHNRFVLIDFGFALGTAQNALPAGTPLYWPPEAFSAATPPASLDRYALALVLFRALTGTLPFIGSDKQQLELPLLTDQRARRLAETLLAALDPDDTKRPPSTASFSEQLHSAFHTIDVPTETNTQLQPQINQWVDLVRGLMRTSASGNGDNRGLDTDFVRETYVPTALDTTLLPNILHYRPKVVFLSGNPGDGKTAFLEQVRLQLRADGATKIADDPSGWEYVLNDHTYRSCYDASESHGELSADQQLSARLAGLEGKPLPAMALTVLVAINDGRLAYFLDRYADTFGAIKQLVATARAQGTKVDQAVWLIDLKQRAFIALTPSATPTLARQVLNTLVAPEHWSICATCSAQATCPITANAQALRQRLVAERLEQLLLLAHLRRQRHITMRDLRSTLALLITGNKTCIDIHAAHLTGNFVQEFQSLAYWQAAFTTNDGSDELLGDLTMLDPARQSQPALDRYLHHAHAAPNDPRRELDRANFESERAWMGAIKRQMYFTASDAVQPANGMPATQATQLLPYRHTRKYIELLSDTADQTVVRERIAQGLLRSDGLPIQAPPGTLSLRVVYSEQQQLAIVKQFPLEQFVVEVLQPQSGAMVESIPELVLFRHTDGAPRIELPMELFELLMRLADGADPYSEEYKPLLEELAPFKSAMLLREANELVLIESYGQTYTVTQRETQIVLTTS